MLQIFMIKSLLDMALLVYISSKISLISRDYLLQKEIIVYMSFYSVICHTSSRLIGTLISVPAK